MGSQLMTCRARRESFFWLPVRQCFLFSLLSFSLFSFLFFSFFQPSRRPCLGSSRLSRAVSACLSRQSSISPIDNPGYPVFLLSSNLFTKQQRQKRSERQFNPPQKSQVFWPSPGHFFFPSPSPRLASFFALNCQRVVRDVTPPTFPLPSSRALKQNLSAVHLPRPFFFFPDPFCLHPLHVSRLTQQVQTTRPQLVHFLSMSNSNAPHMQWKLQLRMLSTSVFFLSHWILVSGAI